MMICSNVFLLLLVVAPRHKTSLLVSIARDSKVRVWNVTAPTIRSSCCVGLTSLPGAPINIKCHESLLYAATSSSVVAVDLRTMQKVLTAAAYQPFLYSFEMIPSKSLICTGGRGRHILKMLRLVEKLLM
ncbi:uncharacterized protein LOC111470222 [Cucurbita maxima]|uniref:Uncharacterized protein LOC111470222 n=1 Tax=Cucurbita maxima TaxID=3661 RepID=A0A6J1I754_CUCMA|nr:uncharacterized protein LOC111470222 [Cucurbita maxima]XP_022971543.1 uncharacterized protein LOC111470222 [Cucurbita maxima]